MECIKYVLQEEHFIRLWGTDKLTHSWQRQLSNKRCSKRKLEFPPMTATIALWVKPKPFSPANNVPPWLMMSKASMYAFLAHSPEPVSSSSSHSRIWCLLFTHTKSAWSTRHSPILVLQDKLLFLLLTWSALAVQRLHQTHKYK